MISFAQPEELDVPDMAQNPHPMERAPARSIWSRLARMVGREP
jgi:hypothetical protein